MAKLSKSDLLKRDNISVFTSRIKEKGSFKLGTGSGELLTATGKLCVYINKTKTIYDSSKHDISEVISAVCNSKKSSDKFEIECVSGNSKKYYTLSKLFKDSSFGGVASKGSSAGGSERQELGLISLINESCMMGECYIDSINRRERVIGARKREGMSKAKQEPYIDVFVTTETKEYGISCKGTSAPSLAGGGLVGLKLVVPDLVDRLMKTIETYLKNQGYSEGSVVHADSIPDLFIEVPDSYIREILIGNEFIGGPIDYMYVGSMSVSGSRKKNKIDITNGRFYSIDEYIKKVGKLFFRIRKRDLPSDKMIEIKYKQKQAKTGYPIFFGSLNSNTKTHLRIVTVDKPTSKGTVLKLEK